MLKVQGRKISKYRKAVQSSNLELESVIDYVIKVWRLFSRQSKVVASHYFVVYVM